MQADVQGSFGEVLGRDVELPIMIIVGPGVKLSSNIDGISTSGRLRILVNKDHCVPHLSVNGFGTTVAYCS